MTLTEAVLVIALSILLIYDIIAGLSGGLSVTISYQVAQLSKKYPIIPFTAGVLMGHFFWQMT